MANNLKGYDANQVLRSVFDVEDNCLRVCVVEGTTGGGGGFEVIITHTDDSIRLGDGSQLVTATLVLGKVGLDVNVINEVDIENLDASKDNVAIHDADGDELDINPDGSINTQPVPNSSVDSFYKYNEISSVASAVETLIVSHTAVGGRDTYLQKITTSGENIAEFRIKVNGIVVDKQRTYFGGNLNTKFLYDGEMNPGMFLNIGDVLEVFVLHNRPNLADFNSKIQYIEVI